MSATIRVFGMTATFDGKWSGDPKLVALAKLATSGVRITGATPDRDWEYAAEAIRVLGGEIIAHEPPEYVEGRVY